MHLIFFRSELLTVFVMITIAETKETFSFFSILKNINMKKYMCI